MKSIHRPFIKLNLSTLEIILFIVSFTLILSGCIYFIINWNAIPRIILIKGGRSDNVPKLNYFVMYVFFSFQLLFISIFGIPSKRNDNNINQINKSFILSRSVSSNLLKAKKQYRIERSLFLFITLIIQTYYSTTAIGQIEYQLGHISGEIKNKLPFIPLSLIIITWMIHHILWTRLSDKKS